MHWLACKIAIHIYLIFNGADLKKIKLILEVNYFIFGSRVFKKGECNNDIVRRSSSGVHSADD